MSVLDRKNNIFMRVERANLEVDRMVIDSFLMLNQKFFANLFALGPKIS